MLVTGEIEKHDKVCEAIKEKFNREFMRHHIKTAQGTEGWVYFDLEAVQIVADLAQREGELDHEVLTCTLSP